MEEIWMRIFENLGDRLDGPLKFRLLLQPVMAAIFAIMAGVRDARLGKPPYFWALATDSGHRSEMLRDGWKDIGKVFILAVVLDVVYQVIVLGFMYPGEVMLVAIALAILPYLVLRGLVTRIARLF